MQDNTPLAGASGAIMGLFGMEFAAVVRLRLMRKQPVVDVIKSGPVFFILAFAFQFWFDHLVAEARDAGQSSAQ